jgi:hypothetical protein
MQRYALENFLIELKEYKVQQLQALRADLSSALSFLWAMISPIAQRSRHSKFTATIVISETCGKLFGTPRF